MYTKCLDGSHIDAMVVQPGVTHKETDEPFKLIRHVVKRMLNRQQRSNSECQVSFESK